MIARARQAYAPAVNPSKSHSFPLPNQLNERQRCIDFANYALKDASATLKVRRYAATLLLDILRPEFPSNSFRDLVTSFSHWSESTAREIGLLHRVTLELFRNKLFTAVLILVSENCLFAKITSELEAYCDQRKERQFHLLFRDILSRNLICDTMKSPCEQLPYLRVRTSGKHTPRAFVDSNGAVYDCFGVKRSGLTYDTVKCLLHETQQGIAFFVPLVHFENAVLDTTHVVAVATAVAGATDDSDDERQTKRGAASRRTTRKATTTRKTTPTADARSEKRAKATSVGLSLMKLLDETCCFSFLYGKLGSDITLSDFAKRSLFRAYAELSVLRTAKAPNLIKAYARKSASKKKTTVYDAERTQFLPPPARMEHENATFLNDEVIYTQQPLVLTLACRWHSNDNIFAKQLNQAIQQTRKVFIYVNADRANLALDPLDETGTGKKLLLVDNIGQR